jgi:hypothetical protein
MLLLGVFVAFRFGERNFERARERRLARSVSILRRGIGLARRDREILLVFAATVLVNGAGEVAGRLDVKQLVELGLPEAPHPIVWLTLLGLVALALAALALRIVEARIDGVGAARRVYSGACAVGALGLLVLALAPDARTALAGILLAKSMTWPLTRTVGVIWVNRRTPSEVRATVQSLLAQAECAGEIALGVSLAVLAQGAGLPFAFIGASALLVLATVLVLRSRAGFDGGPADASTGAVDHPLSAAPPRAPRRGTPRRRGARAPRARRRRGPDRRPRAEGRRARRRPRRRARPRGRGCAR